MIRKLRAFRLRLIRHLLDREVRYAQSPSDWRWLARLYRHYGDPTSAEFCEHQAEKAS